jgi:hypothetical protein
LQVTPKSRPTGVTIIAILNIIGAIIMLLGGIVLLVAGAIIPSLPASTFEQGNVTGIPPYLIGTGAGSLGTILIAIGIVSFIVAYGLIKGLGWAWTLTVALSIISIVLNAISIAMGNIGGMVSIIIISGVILYYLYRQRVKAYFGKGITPASTNPV